MSEKFSESDFLKALFPLLKTPPSVILPPGDDCAVILCGSKKLAFSVDQVIENRHYTPQDLPFAVGRKLLARCLSDLAAVGASPLFALSCSATAKKDLQWLLDFHQGIIAEAEKFSVALIGGDLATTSTDSVNSLTIIGEVKGQIATRSQAQNGDSIFVTGSFGRSFPTQHHLFFTPRVNEGIWLAQYCHAMIDITDGLLTDALRVSEASNCGIVLHVDKIPARDNSSIKERLTDGEDYELLFAVSPQLEEQLLANWQFLTPLTKIGYFSDSIPAGVAVDSSSQDLTNLYGKGFDHFYGN